MRPFALTTEKNFDQGFAPVKESGIWQFLLLEIVNSNVYTDFIKVSHRVEDLTILDLSIASVNEKWHLTIPFATSCQYFCVYSVLSNIPYAQSAFYVNLYRAVIGPSG